MPQRLSLIDDIVGIVKRPGLMHVIVPVGIIRPRFALWRGGC
jgi:hypothetical protein